MFAPSNATRKGFAPGVKGTLPAGADEDGAAPSCALDSVSAGRTKSPPAQNATKAQSNPTRPNAGTRFCLISLASLTSIYSTPPTPYWSLRQPAWDRRAHVNLPRFLTDAPQAPPYPVTKSITNHQQRKAKEEKERNGDARCRIRSDKGAGGRKCL